MSRTSSDHRPLLLALPISETSSGPGNISGTSVSTVADQDFKSRPFPILPRLRGRWLARAARGGGRDERGIAPIAPPSASLRSAPPPGYAFGYAAASETHLA